MINRVFVPCCKEEKYMKQKKFTRFAIAVCAFVMCISLAFTALAGTAEMTKQQRLKNTVYLQNLNYAAACDGVLTVINKNDKTVMPVFRDGLFYVPLRFILEYYGAEVSWEHETKTVIIKAGDNVFRLDTRSSALSMGERSRSLDNSCFIDKGTTFICFDDVSDIIVCKTYYFEEYKSGVIAMGEEWNPERNAEKEALEAMEFALSPFFKMFI